MEIPHSNPNNFDQLQPTPGIAPDFATQQVAELPEAAGNTAPTEALHALGGTAVGHGDFISSSIGGLKLGEEFTWGEYDKGQGKNVIKTATFRGVDANRNPVIPIVTREAEPAGQTAALVEEAPSTEVMKPSQPNVAVLPPESDPMAGLTTSEKMSRVEAALHERGMVDGPMVSEAAADEETPFQTQPTPRPERVSRSSQEDEEEDFSERTYTSKLSDENKAARAAATRDEQRVAPAKAEPGARAAAEAAEALKGEEFAVDDGIPRAAEPEDLHTGGPRLDRRPIQYE